MTQETENGTIESQPFILIYTENGYVCTWLDSDEDGLPDYMEDIYGTDPHNSDTDNDGLTDYEELFQSNTNPAKYDTDENGINDADDDIDGDGLTNNNELKLGTSLSNADTDGDGLSDYDEINKHNTDPLKADSDSDTLNDADEIAIGLDPNNPETFGEPDAEYKVEQSISADSDVLQNVNTEESPYELSLDITASGNVSGSLVAGNSKYSAITESNARLGGAVSLSYLSGDVDSVKLSYTIADEYISNDGSVYAENCVDLQGIKRYNIFRYFEELNMLLPVATEFDEESNTLYAVTDELGTYCVMDMEIMLRNFGIAPNGISIETVEAVMYASASTYATSFNGEYYVTFVLDVRNEKISEEQLNTIKEEIRDFAETAYVEEKNIKIRLLTQTASDFETPYDDVDKCLYDDFVALSEALDDIELSYKEGILGDYCVVTDALDAVISVSDYNNANFIFTIYNQSNAIYEQGIVDKLFLNAAENGVGISVISPTDEMTGFQNDFVDDSNGIFINRFDDFAGEVYEYVFDSEYDHKTYIPPKEPQNEFDAILITGYEHITLDSILYANGENPDGIDSDTDDDGLTDWDEVDVPRWEKAGLISVEENGYINLPSLQECMNYTELSYVEEGLNRFLGTYNVIHRLSNMEVLPISTDPTNADTDMDTYTDNEDLDCLTPFVNPIMLLHGRTSNSFDTFGFYTSICPYQGNVIEYYNNTYGNDIIVDGVDYSDVNRHTIDVKHMRYGKLGSYLIDVMRYEPNRNLFAFNYPNQDFAINNAQKLFEYIDNIKIEITNSTQSKDFFAVYSDIYATKSDLENGTARFILIGHSNGGLVSRYYIENMGGDKNVDKLITIDTPHFGADIANASTIVLQRGYTLGIACPLDVELRPDSSLFTGKKYEYGFLKELLWGYLGNVNLYTIFNSAHYHEKMQYIVDNQSDRLRGNTKELKL